MLSWFTHSNSRRVLLPILLVGLTIVLLGCYYETNDDYSMVTLLRGQGLPAPVASFPLYMHGVAAALAAFYGALPAVPWYGLLLLAELMAAAMLLFWVIDRALPGGMSPRWKVILLSLFFLAALLESILRVNFTRPSILLAGAVTPALIINNENRSWMRGLGLALLLWLAWTLRPGATWLGWLVVLPAISLLGLGRWGLRAALGAGLVLALASGGQTLMSQSATQRAVRQLDTNTSQLVDYHILRRLPSSKTDSLRLEAPAVWWGLGDTATAANRALFARATSRDLGFFVRAVVPAKAASLLPRLVGDYFLLVFFNLLVVVLVSTADTTRGHRLWWLYQLFIGGLLLALGLVLQLPARVATPILTLQTAINILYAMPALPALSGWLRTRPTLARSLSGITLLLLLVYGAKTLSRAYRHRQTEQRYAAYIGRIAALSAGRPVVHAGMGAAYGSLGVLRHYPALTTGPSFTLNGWTSTHPSQLAVMQRLAQRPGETQVVPYSTAILRIMQRPDVLWLMPPGFSTFLPRYIALKEAAVPAFCFVPEPVLLGPGDETLEQPLPQQWQACAPTAVLNQQASQQ